MRSAGFPLRTARSTSNDRLCSCSIPTSSAKQDALAAADLMAPLVGGGQNLALQDIWLAGVAFGRNFIFVTRNRRDFDRITGLKVENWFD